MSTPLPLQGIRPNPGLNDKQRSLYNQILHGHFINTKIPDAWYTTRFDSNGNKLVSFTSKVALKMRMEPDYKRNLRHVINQAPTIGSVIACTDDRSGYCVTHITARHAPSAEHAAAVRKMISQKIGKDKWKHYSGKENHTGRIASTYAATNNIKNLFSNAKISTKVKQQRAKNAGMSVAKYEKKILQNHYESIKRAAQGGSSVGRRSKSSGSRSGSNAGGTSLFSKYNTSTRGPRGNASTISMPTVSSTSYGSRAMSTQNIINQRGRSQGRRSAGSVSMGRSASGASRASQSSRRQMEKAQTAVDAMTPTQRRNLLKQLRQAKTNSTNQSLRSQFQVRPASSTRAPSKSPSRASSKSSSRAGPSVSSRAALESQLNALTSKQLKNLQDRLN